MMSVTHKSAAVIARHALPLIYLCGLVLIGGLFAPSAHGQAQGSMGGYLALTNVFFGEGTNVFGPGQTVTISGVIPHVYNGGCPSMFTTDKFPKPFLGIYPVADFYVMKDDGTPLNSFDSTPE